MNNGLIQICDRLLACNQYVFVKGRFILESVASTHEIIHDVVSRNKKVLVLMLYYEKAYDCVNCHFLEEMMSTRGFDPRWISRVMKLVKGGSISVRLNDKNSSFLKHGKGLR
jgi:hypothetical protein